MKKITVDVLYQNKFHCQFSHFLFYFFHIYRAPIGQGYGLTETCAGATFSEYDDTSVGRVGPPIPCSVIKVNIFCLNFPR